ncbi:replication initiation protein, partial [Salmonella enterica subsp. enterica serovar Enteritidis]|nr:replication initiation protein [Salmonella enterica subsp. enterica serovar Enteritidis]
MKIRLTSEDFVRLSPGAACFLRGTLVLPAKISLILLPEWPEM